MTGALKSSPRVGDSRVWPVLLLAAAMLAATALVLHLTRGLTFYQDEWSFIIDRQGHDLDTLLRPHNEHSVIVSLLVYKVLFQVMGLSHYWPYMAVEIACHLLCAGLLFLIARSRVGTALAVPPALLLLFFGPGWEDILWAFQTGFLIPIAATLAMLLALDRGDRVGDFLASGFLVVALASGSLGAPAAAAAGLEILLGPDRWRRLVRVLAVPALLYGAWRLSYPVHSADTVDDVASVPGIAVDLVGATLSALLSLDADWGWVLATALGVAIVVRVARPAGRSRRLAALILLAVLYFGLTAYFRPFVPPPSRYLYPGAVLLLLIVIELARGIRPGRAGLAAAYAVTALLVALNIGELSDGADEMRPFSDFLAAPLGALELASETVQVEPGFQPAPLVSSFIVADRYFSATAKFGSPALPPEEIAGRGEEVRRASDAVFFNAVRVALQPSAGLPVQPGPVPAVTRASGGRVSERNGCVHLDATGAGPGEVELRVLPPGMALGAAPGDPAEVRLRRFAEEYGPADVPPGRNVFAPDPRIAAVLEGVYGQRMHRLPSFRLEGGSSGTLAVGRDHLARPWHVRLVTAGSVTACGLSG